MLKNRFTRHTIAFLTIALVSIFLYPIAQAGSFALAWIFLGLAVLAAINTLTTK